MASKSRCVQQATAGPDVRPASSIPSPESPHYYRRLRFGRAVGSRRDKGHPPSKFGGSNRGRGIGRSEKRIVVVQAPRDRRILYPRPRRPENSQAFPPTKPNVQYDYDTEGRVTDVQDAEALQVGDRTVWEFLIGDGTRGERDDPLGDAWSVTYDIYGHPAFYTDENGYVTNAVADGRGRITSFSTADFPS